MKTFIKHMISPWKNKNSPILSWLLPAPVSYLLDHHLVHFVHGLGTGKDWKKGWEHENEWDILLASPLETKRTVYGCLHPDICGWFLGPVSDGPSFRTIKRVKIVLSPEIPNFWGIWIAIVLNASLHLGSRPCVGSCAKVHRPLHLEPHACQDEFWERENTQMAMKFGENAGYFYG